MPKKIVIIIAAILLVGAGAAIPLVLHRAPHTTAARPKPKPQTEPVEMDEFLINLADLNEQHYLKCTLVLEMVKTNNKKSGGEEGDKDPDTARIRDAIITTMGRKHFAELLAPEGKQQLKEAIIRDVNKVLGREAVTEVYFTSFAMQ